jgi:prolyl 4-hydroxylase
MIINLLNSLPKIVEIENFLTEKECDEIIDKNLPFVRSKGFDFSSGTSEEVDARTSSSFFDIKDDLKNVRSKIHFLSSMLIDNNRVSLRLSNLELLQLTRYVGDEKYVSHYDYFNHLDLPKEKLVSNDRVATFIVYLNDDFLNGHTSFEKLDIKVKPKKGNALYFDYCYDSKINELTMHSGDPPVEGTKTIMTCWIRKYPYTN